jgi:hypothetical protein
VGKRGWVVIVLALAAVVVLVAVVDLGFRSHRGTIRGELVLVGGTASGAGNPLPGVVTFRSRNGDIQTVTTRDGSFSIDLPAGHYKVAGRSPLFRKDAKICGGGTEVSVRRSRTLFVSVRCEGA